METLANPHDHFLKRTLSNSETAAELLRHYLPGAVVEQLDLSLLELSKDSFVDKELREHFSDLLYRTRLRDGRSAYVYVLLEHKSAPERWVVLQLLRYMVRIWEREPKEERFLPPIVPLVLYHGRSNWSVPTSFAGLFDVPREFLRYVPDYRYQLLDLSRYSDEEIKGTILLRATLLLMKHVFQNDLPEQAAQVVRMLVALPEKETALEYLETMLRYLAASESISEEGLRTAVMQGFPEGEPIMSTLIELWKEQGRTEGLKQGRTEGLEQGRAEAARQHVLRIVAHRFGEASAREAQDALSGLTVADLEALIDVALDADSAEGFAKELKKRS